jgi:hypothetical protein
MEKVFCSKCGRECVSDGCGTGYGVDAKGNKICYDCCGEMDKEQMKQMKPGDRITLYLTSGKDENGCSGHFVTNWPGTLKIKVYAVEGRHNFAGVRRDVHFKYMGNFFHGTQYGNFSEICHVRCIRSWN